MELYKEGKMKKVKIDESITVDEWKQHFISLLEWTERNRGEERRIKVEGGETEEIKKENIEKVIRKLKKGKECRRRRNKERNMEIRKRKRTNVNAHSV